MQVFFWFFNVVFLSLFLIASANGPLALELDLAKSNERLQASEKLVALHKLTAELFHMYAESGNAGGDGVVMVAPWDPNFHYCFTLACAFIWAQAIERSEANKHMPPNSSEFKSEIAKTRVLHPGLKLKDRLKLCFPSLKIHRVTNVGASKKRQVEMSPTKKQGKYRTLGYGLVSPSSRATASNKKTEKLNNIDLISSSDEEDLKPLKLKTGVKIGSPSIRRYKRNELSGKASSTKKAKVEPAEFKTELNSDGFLPPPDRFYYLEEDKAVYSDAVMSAADNDELELLMEHMRSSSSSLISL
ncbi:uncharacterized protein MELLADRAFT_95362 [Melampsora larici-populina 98AG31]|uniref:Secreted protein n=1 Tax=Melampsora larici-populina (strain 98AG31 / pathotype 3-4-7) TaxID=747676 RepID=F4RD58_MELLP|nr:uncharacterized protein MELLADRAFT_95362 [Melampsora larici-populina 98AG31]EGG09845.1 hypothetical protein MELLADRAFT_95362 [Melampsora larici-populina 98AG31]